MRFILIPLILLFDNVFGFENLANCGGETFKREFYTRIIGGRNASSNHWGWHIQIKKDGKNKCSGSIINNQWILSAARCFDDVYIGKASVNQYQLISPHKEEKMKILNAYRHSEFNKASNINDIILIKLKEKLNFEKNFYPVCLPKKCEFNCNTYKKGYATGYGHTTFNGKESEYLKEILIEIYTPKQCELYFQMFDVDFDSNYHLCAGSLIGNVCDGDEGGPLVSRDVNDRKFYLLGIFSYGIESAECKDFKAFTRVKNYIDWIDGVLEKYSS